MIGHVKLVWFSLRKLKYKGRIVLIISYEEHSETHFDFFLEEGKMFPNMGLNLHRLCLGLHKYLVTSSE